MGHRSYLLRNEQARGADFVQGYRISGVRSSCEVTYSDLFELDVRLVRGYSLRCDDVPARGS